MMLHEIGMTQDTHKPLTHLHKCHNRKPLQSVMYGVSASTHEPYTQECRTIGNETERKCDGCRWRPGSGHAIGSML